MTSCHCALQSQLFCITPYVMSEQRQIKKQLDKSSVVAGETLLWLYTKQHEERWGCLTSHGCPLSLSLPSVFSPPLPRWGPSSLGVVQYRSGRGHRQGITQQIWQPTQSQPLGCLSGCHRDQRAPAAGTGLPVFHTSDSWRGRAARDGRCYLQKQKRTEGAEGGLLTQTVFFPYF